MRKALFGFLILAVIIVACTITLEPGDVEHKVFICIVDGDTLTANPDSIKCAAVDSIP